MKKFINKVFFWFKSFGNSYNEYQELKDLKENYYSLITLKKDDKDIFDGKWKKCAFYFRGFPNEKDLWVDEVKIEKTKKKSLKGMKIKDIIDMKGLC